MKLTVPISSLEISDALILSRKALSALSDETRQQIVLALLACDQNGVRVGDLTNITRLSRPSISHHLQILKDAELIHMRRDGTKNYYYISSDRSRWKALSELLSAIYSKVSNIR